MDRLRASIPSAGQGVTMLELFFDLVFVFTVTQLTGLVRSSGGASGYLHAGALLLLTWWMYDGYAWLSNNVGPLTWSTRIPMLIGMTGLLVMAIATPDAFGSAGWAFAGAYLVVIVVHAVQFSRSSLGNSAHAIRTVLPLNLALPGLLFLAAALGERWGWIAWIAAAVAVLCAPFLVRSGSFALRGAHFAERHQLVVIIALGETIVATGVGAEGRLRHVSVVLAVLLAMALVSALWWIYFGGDDQDGAAALETALDTGRVDVPWVYAGVHLFHVAGLVLVAAGLEEVVAEPAHGLGPRLALTMAAGCALFLTAQYAYLRLLAVRTGVELYVGALVVLAVAAAVHAASGVLVLAALVVVLVATVLVRGARRLRVVGADRQ